MYTISASFFYHSHAQDAGNFGPRIPPEPQPLPSRDGDEASPFRGDEAWATDRAGNAGETQKENESGIGRRVASGSKRSAGAGGPGGTLYDGRSTRTSRIASFVLQWTPKAEEELNALQKIFADRITAKMHWFAAQKNPLSFAKRLSGIYVDHWRFRIGEYRCICNVIDGHVRVLRVLSVKNRREAYRTRSVSCR